MESVKFSVCSYKLNFTTIFTFYKNRLLFQFYHCVLYFIGHYQNLNVWEVKTHSMYIPHKCICHLGSLSASRTLMLFSGSFTRVNGNICNIEQNRNFIMWCPCKRLSYQSGHDWPTTVFTCCVCLSHNEWGYSLHVLYITIVYCLSEYVY